MEIRVFSAALPAPQPVYLAPGHPLTVDEAIARLRKDPTSMADMPEEVQLVLLTRLLEDEDEEPNIYFLLIAAVCAGPLGVIRLMEYLSFNPALRRAAAGYRLAGLVSRLTDGIVEAVLQHPDVQKAIAAFQQTLRERPIGKPIEA